MTITRGSLQKQLRPGLNAIFGMEYKSVDNEHLPLFEIENSDKNYEEEVLMTGFETAPVKSEGAPVEFDDASEAYVARYVHETIALAFAITQEAMEDNLYDSLSKIKAKQLGRAMANTKQTKAANIYNLGFSGGPSYGDGVVLFSASHPTRAGNQSNLETGDISETTLETAIINTALIKDDRGVLIGAQARSIHVAPAEMFNIQKILGSELSTMVQGPAGSQPGVAGDGVTNTNKINVLRSNKYLPGGWHVNHRFTDDDAWFLRTDVTNGPKHMIRKKIETGMEGDWDTDILKYKARERYSFGVSDWRALRGSAGS
jgi:hypothetical protein